MKKFDLHTHTRYSDGTLSPAEVVARALKSGVATLFITDHDSVSGFPEAEAAARGSGMSVQCGIEINTCQRDQVHILGYGIDWEAPAFRASLEEFRQRRATRVRRIVDRLRLQGVSLTFEDVQGASQETLGRPHVADALKRKGFVGSRKEAFARFLTRGKPGYVDPMGPTPAEAISLIKGAGGFASLAHPETVKDLSKDLPEWMALGLEGIEVYYGAYHPSSVLRFQRVAEERGLLCTGGSDYHGPGTGRETELGVSVPDPVFGKFMERLARC